MDKSRLVFGGLIVVIAIISVGMVMGVSDTSKTDTKLKIKASSPIHEGDKIKIKLMDANNTTISNKTVNVTLKDENNESYNYSVTTNDKGVAKLKLDKGAGEYEVICNFTGDDKYNPCNKTIKITIEEEVVEEEESYEDSGAFYSAQEGRVIYTGEIHDAPDGNRYEHLGNNEWVMVE